MCSTDYEPSKVWHQRRVRAAKPHVCYECGLSIPKGRDYIRTTAFLDSWDTFRVHPECDTLSDFVRKEVCEANGEHGLIQMGGLGEEISSLGEYGPMGTEAERGEVLALGFEPYDPQTGEGSTARDVCEWLWDIAKEQYRTTEVTRG